MLEEEKNSYSIDIVEGNPNEFDSTDDFEKDQEELENTNLSFQGDEKQINKNSNGRKTKENIENNESMFYCLVTPNYKQLITPNKIKRIRRRINLSEKNFADLIGVTLETVLKWESGENIPSGPTLRLLYLLSKHIEQSRELFCLVDTMQ